MRAETRSLVIATSRHPLCDHMLVTSKSSPPCVNLLRYLEVHKARIGCLSAKSNLLLGKWLITTRVTSQLPSSAQTQELRTAWVSSNGLRTYCSLTTPLHYTTFFGMSDWTLWPHYTHNWNRRFGQKKNAWTKLVHSYCPENRVEELWWRRLCIWWRLQTFSKSKITAMTTVRSKTIQLVKSTYIVTKLKITMRYGRASSPTSLVLDKGGTYCLRHHLECSEARVRSDVQFQKWRVITAWLYKEQSNTCKTWHLHETTN